MARRIYAVLLCLALILTGTETAFAAELTNDSIMIDYVDENDTGDARLTESIPEGQSISGESDTVIIGDSEDSLSADDEDESYIIHEDVTGEGESLMPEGDGEHKHCVCCSATSCGDDHNADQVWQPWGSTTALPVEAGYYYLTENVTLTESLQPADGVHLCINGKTINMGGYRYNGAGSLTIANCKGKNTGGFEWKDSQLSSGSSRLLLSAPDLKLYNTSFTVSNLTGEDVFIAGNSGNNSSSLYIDNCIIKREDTDSTSGDRTFLVYSDYPTTATILNSSISCEGENSKYLEGIYVNAVSGKLTIRDTDVEINSASTDVWALNVTDNKKESDTPAETVSVSDSFFKVTTTSTSASLYDCYTAVSVCSDGYSTFSFTDCTISATATGPAAVEGLYLDVMEYDSYRAYCTANLEDCIITATSSGTTYGIEAEGALNLTGGTVTASGAENNCVGIYLNPERSGMVYNVTGTTITGVNRGIHSEGYWPEINLVNATVSASAESDCYGLYTPNGNVYLGGSTLISGTQGGIYKTAYREAYDIYYNRPEIYAYAKNNTPLTIENGKSISIYYGYEYAETGDPIITDGMTNALKGKLTISYPEGFSIGTDGKLITPTKSQVTIPNGITGGSGGVYSDPERTKYLPGGEAFEGQTVYIKAFPDYHFSFSKWEVRYGGVTLDNANAAETFFVMGNKSVDLSPVFTEQEHYTVSYKGGSQSDGWRADYSDKKYKGEDLELPGYRYVFMNKAANKVQDGWSLTDGGSKAYDLGAVYTEDKAITLYPHWVESVKITFNFGDFPTGDHQAHTVVPRTPLHKTPGQGFYLYPDYEDLFGFRCDHEGANVYYKWTDAEGFEYELRGLTKEADSTSANYKKDYDFGQYFTGDEDIVLYPYMVKDVCVRYFPDEYTANPEEEAPVQTKRPGSATKITLYGYVEDKVKHGLYESNREWYQQGGWATEEGGEKVYELGAKYSGNDDLTLYPYWEPIYKVAYDPGQYGINPEGDKEIYHKKYHDISIKLYDALFVRPGYIQTGWNTQENGGGTHFNLNSYYVLNADNTLYPEWQETKKITYMPDEKCGDGALPVYQTKTSGVAATLLSDVFTAEGYKLIGWNETKGSTNVQYAAGAEYNTDANLTVYPVWRELTYGLFVGGTRVTSTNLNDILGNGGKVSYDPDTFTLTLNNANITGFYKKQTQSGYAGIGIYAGDESDEADVQVDRLRIKLIGNNTIDPDFADCNQGIGIFASSADSLEILGSGSLTIGNSDSASCKMTHAIRANIFKLKDAALTLYAHGICIYANDINEEPFDWDGAFIVESGTLNATVWDDGCAAIYVEGFYEAKAVAIKGGIVNLTTLGGMGQSNGQQVPPSAIFVSVNDRDAVEISGGEITLTNQGAAGVGIMANCEYTEQEMSGFTYYGIKYYAGTTTINAKTAMARIYANEVYGVEFAPIYLGKGVTAVGGEDAEHAEAVTDPELLSTCKYAKLEGGAGPDRAYLHLGETTVTDNNLSGDGWAYDPFTKTLTLNNYDLSTAYVVRHDDGEDSWENTYGIYANGDLNIILKGTSSVGIDKVIPLYGIYSSGTITVSGDGYINVYGVNNGIFAYEYYVSNGGTVEAGASMHYGIYAGYGMEVNGGKTVIDSESDGICTEDNIIVKNGGLFVTSEGTAASCYNYTQSGGEVSLVSKSDSATGTEEPGFFGGNNALTVRRDMTVTGGSLYAEAYEKCIYGTGADYTMTVGGGNVLVKPRSDDGCAIDYDYVKITSGFLEITGGYEGIAASIGGVSVTGGRLLIDVTAGKGHVIYGGVAVNRPGLGYTTSPDKPLSIRYGTYNLNDCYNYDYLRIAGVCAIAYKPGTGVTGESFGETKETGKSIELKGALFTKDGYLQDGWALSDGGDKAYELGAIYSQDADLILYPHWAVVAYTVTYKPGANSKEKTEYADPVAADGKVTFRDVTYTRDNYVQIGWATVDDAVNVGYDLGAKGTITGNLTLYPVFSNAVKVTYDKGSKGKGENVTVDTTINAQITLKYAIFTRAGYKQTGWSLTDGGDKAYDLCAVTAFTGDTTLYPVWARDHKLTYLPGTAPATGDVRALYEDDAIYTVNIKAGQEVKLAEALFEHIPGEGGKQYVQVGWSDQINYGGEDFYRLGETVTFTVSASLYPVWTRVKPQGEDDFWIQIEGARKVYIKGTNIPVYVLDYKGSALKPEVRVYDEKTLLNLKQDYTLAIKNNTNADMTAANLALQGKKVTDELDAKQLKKLPCIQVKGKGNYGQDQTVYFSIAPVDISTGGYEATDDYSFEFTEKKGKAAVYKPMPEVNGSLNGKVKKLKVKKEFSISYYKVKGNDYTLDENGLLETEGQALPGISEEGKYVIRVEGIGNFTGKITLKAEVNKKISINGAKVTFVKSLPYTGAPVKQDPSKVTVKAGKNVLPSDAYELTYESNVEIGMATMIVTPKERSEYAGKVRVKFAITGTDISKVKVDDFAGSFEYDGTEKKQAGAKLYILNKDKSKSYLTEGKDYTCAYTNNINAGTATVSYTGKGAYTGSLNMKFKINPFNAGTNTGNRIAVNVEKSVVYVKDGAVPEVTVTFMKGNNETVTLSPSDYKVTLKNNKAVNDGTGKKKPSVSISFMNNFKGKVDGGTFKITVKDINNLPVLKAGDPVYSNKKDNYVTTIIAIDNNGKELKAGTDWNKNAEYYYGQNVTVINNKKEAVREDGDAVVKGDIVPAGTKMKVKITGTENYSGEKTLEYKMKTSDISKAKVTFNKQFYYDKGKEIKPEKGDLKLEIKQGKNWVEIPAGRYEILNDSYADNVKVGTGSFRIIGSGNDYGGVLTVKFKILPRWMQWLFG